MISKNRKAAGGVPAAYRQNEKLHGTSGNLKQGPVNSGDRTATRSQREIPRKPGSSWSSRRDSGGPLVEAPKVPFPREKNVSEYQGNYKAWPALSVRKRRPTDCIRLKGNIDLVTNYANVYKGVKGKVAKLVRPQDTVGNDPVPFKTLSEYQDKYKVWSVLPVRSKKPEDYRARGDVEFLTNYAQEYKAWKIQKRLPFIQLEQTAMPVGPFESITSYRNDFGRKRLPSSNMTNGIEPQFLIRWRQLPRSVPATESRESRVTEPQRHRQPVDVASR